MSSITSVPKRLGWLLPLFPFALAICGLVATFFLSDLLAKRELNQLESRTESEAKHVAAQVRIGVLRAFEPLQRIAAWWRIEGRPLAPEDWDADTTLFVRARAGLRRLTWVDSRERHAWTIRAGVESDAGRREPLQPELRRIVEVAARSNSTEVSQVFVDEGKPVVYACSPVHRGGKIRAFIAGLYDVGELAGSVLEGQVPDDYSVVVIADGREISAVTGPAHRNLSGGAREARISIGNRLWTLRIIPSADQIATLRRLVLWFGGLVSVLLYACGAIALVARRRAAQLAGINQRLIDENRERNRAEEKIAELNRDLERRLHELQVLLDVLPVGIAVADDPECRKIWMNRSMAEMLRLSQDRNISQTGPPGLDPGHRLQAQGKDVPPDELPMQMAARTGETVANRELDIVRNDGSVLHTLSYSAPVFDEHGAVRGVINACVDITERKRAEAQRELLLIRERELEQRVERAEKYRSLALMAGGIAHDFNNLLTVIIGQGNLLARHLGGSGEESLHTEALLSAAGRAAELTAQLLAFTGHIWCTAAPVDLGEVIESLRESVRELAPLPIDIEYHLEENLPVIQAGVAELQQVIRHLVDNAVESISTSGRIDIRTSQGELSADDLEILYPEQQLTPGRYVRLEVADTGCGIPEEIAPRVFDPFFTTKFVGRGLGLSAVQGIVRAHGGGIRFDSVPHRGTRVEIVFPVGHARPRTGPVLAMREKRQPHA